MWFPAHAAEIAWDKDVPRLTVKRLQCRRRARCSSAALLFLWGDGKGIRGEKKVEAEFVIVASRHIYFGPAKSPSNEKTSRIAAASNVLFYLPHLFFIPLSP